MGSEYRRRRTAFVLVQAEGSSPSQGFCEIVRISIIVVSVDM